MHNSTIIAAGATLAVFTVETAYYAAGKPRRYDDKEKAVNTITLKANGDGTFYEVEEGEGRVSYSGGETITGEDGEETTAPFVRHQSPDRYSVRRDVEPMRARLIVTANLRIEATPIAPIPRGRTTNTWGSTRAYDNWEWKLAATVGGKAVSLTTGDLARLANFAANMTSPDERNVQVF
jgi:hypothetical protein